MLRHTAASLWPGGRGAVSILGAAAPGLLVARLAPQGARLASSNEGGDGKVKQAPNPYALFVKKRNAELKDNKSMTNNEKFRSFGAEWKALSELEKLPFQEESKAYKSALPPKPQTTFASPPTGYNLFCRDNATGRKGSDAVREAAAEWKIAPKDVKAKYKEMARVAAENFKANKTPKE